MTWRLKEFLGRLANTIGRAILTTVLLILLPLSSIDIRFFPWDLDTHFRHLRRLCPRQSGYIWVAGDRWQRGLEVEIASKNSSHVSPLPMVARSKLKECRRRRTIGCRRRTFGEDFALCRCERIVGVHLGALEIPSRTQILRRTRLREVSGGGGEVQGANNRRSFGGPFLSHKGCRPARLSINSIARNASLLKFRRVQSLLSCFERLGQEERAGLVLKGRPTSLAASLSPSGPILIYIQYIPIHVLYEGQRRVRAAAQEVAVLRAPLATKPCLYSVHTVI